MEYTKDIILNIECKKGLVVTKFRDWTSSVKEIINNNKMIIVVLFILTSLIVVDIILVNSFFQLLTMLY